MADRKDDFEAIRQIYTVLMLHFIEGMKQNEISQKMNLSPSKVNRLISQGKKLGMVKISIESPFQSLVELERKLKGIGRLSDAVVTPTVSGSQETTLQQVGRAAGNQLLESLRDGDVIAITGGKAVSAVVENLRPERQFDVTVVPLTGGVQGKFYTDVNHLASRLAEKLGGRTMLLHAPLFAESATQRDLLREMAPVREVFNLGRKAAIALVGIGSVLTPGSSYYDLHLLPDLDPEELLRKGICGEFLAHLICADGQVADHPLNERLVALSPAEIAQCRRVIGVAAGPAKVQPILAALRGRFLHTLVTDEETAARALEALEPVRNVA